MTISIAIHSHKGGTGKTMLTINLGALLAEQGFNVVILDLDLHGPSLQSFAPNRKEPTMHDLFLLDANYLDIVFNANYLLKSPPTGNLYLGLASLDSDKISALENRDKQAPLNDLYKLMGLVKNQLPNPPFNADFIIIDTSPGITPTSINSVAVTDYLIVVLKLINSDIAGTAQLLKTVHESLKPTTFLVVNQMPQIIDKLGGYAKIREVLQSTVFEYIKSQDIEIKAIIPFDEQVIEAELRYALSGMEGKSIPRPIQVYESLDTLYGTTLHALANDLAKLIYR